MWTDVPSGDNPKFGITFLRSASTPTAFTPRSTDASLVEMSQLHSRELADRLKLTVSEVVAPVLALASFLQRRFLRQSQTLR